MLIKLKYYKDKEFLVNTDDIVSAVPRRNPNGGAPWTEITLRGIADAVTVEATVDEIMAAVCGAPVMVPTMTDEEKRWLIDACKKQRHATLEPARYYEASDEARRHTLRQPEESDRA